jgi:hypothetical protein
LVRIGLAIARFASSEPTAFFGHWPRTNNEESVMSIVPKPNCRPGSFWASRREASLNWLALGLLLAAWNASSNDDAAANARRRPGALRAYPHVSVRAAIRVAGVDR